VHGLVAGNGTLRPVPRTKLLLRADASLDRAVVLLDPIIFIGAAPMLDLLPEHFGHGPWIGVMTVGGDLFRTASGDRLGTAEEALGRRHISFRTEHRVDQLPLFVNRSIEIAPSAAYLYICLILSPENLSPEQTLRGFLLEHHGKA
jgi:hypothetical protein